jgi:transcriptional regulator with PAS, ATPase and Fis domain
MAIERTSTNFGEIHLMHCIISSEHDYDLQAVIARLQEAFSKDHTLNNVLEYIEKSLILAAYSRHQQQSTATYQALKIPKTTFYAKWKRYCD